MHALELFISLCGLFVFFTLWLIPLGWCLSMRMLPELSPNIRVLTSFGLSILAYALSTTLLVILGASNGIISWVLYGFLLAALFFWIKGKHYRQLLDKNLLHGLLIFGALFVLSQATLSFPDATPKNASSARTMMLTNLPIDVVLSYNFSRYVLERIDPNAWDTVPDWKATDRGPLAALLTASLFALFGLEDSSRWLVSSPMLFFLYQSLLSYLNLLSLLSVWFILLEYADSRAARFGVLLLGTTYFYYTNVIFAWPKFLAAFYLMLALSLWLQKKNGFLVGLLLAAGILSHDLGMFFSASFLACLGLYQLVLLIRRGCSLPTFFKEIATPVLGLITLYSPWLFYKAYFSPSSPRGVYYHLFCYLEREVDSVSFSDALQWYQDKHSYQEMLYIRLGNIWYPFDPGPLYRLISGYWDQPLVVLSQISLHNFLQFLPAIGIPMALLAVLGLAFYRNEELSWFFWVTFGSLILAALTSGCAVATVNHVWAYPAFICAGLFAGLAASRRPLLGSLLTGLNVGLHLALVILYLFFLSPARAFLHGSFSYFALQAFALVLFILFCLWPDDNVPADKAYVEAQYAGDEQ